MQDPTQQQTQRNTFAAWDGTDELTRPTVPILLHQTFNFFLHRNIHYRDVTSEKNGESDEEIQRRPAYNSNVWGQTCCAEDLLAKEHQLPDLKEGEFIVWENMGRATKCSAFCEVSYPASRHVFIDNLAG
ncbi:hypothetical protein AVEN_180180-1 [Araneus ventricosus]|uniref:Orn/DAP/Arg decarboxylase 2 C-terminal domain-containing protein n=1 Tax=Araneus ventricosus TaxID=182803 RepID=A0A4Y2N265_ARAVE|nr:hypothetical protein AVEN_180180-1 [Araneus ventricosus]